MPALTNAEALASINQAANGNTGALLALLTAFLEGGAPRTYAGSPVSVLTPRRIGERVFDTTNLVFYTAYSLASTGWARAGDSALLATTAELNRSTDVSTRIVAAGATLTLTELLHSDKVIALDTAAGSVLTLPAATGSGVLIRTIVHTKPTSNSHQIKVANGTDVLSGSVNILDNDAAAQTAYAATGTSDTIDMNGTTKGGLIGDWVDFFDIKAGFWAIRGQLVVPAGSNPVTVFSATV